MSETAAMGEGCLRITAPNASPMTWNGTNTYVLGRGPRAVIDPGPDDDGHLAAILAACPEGISHILVTHAHRDHSALVPRLKEATGAPVLAFGAATDGRSPVMARLAVSGLGGGGEGIDAAFRPDIPLRDGARVEGDGWSLSALWTPGHMGSHLCLAWDDVLFTGDHVMGWATSIVSPPDGDLTQYMASLRALRGQGFRRFLPGHGDPVEAPDARLDWLIRHRAEREAQIRAALAEAPGTPADLTRRVYSDLAPGLLPMAERNLFAHLVDLVQRGLVEATPTLAASARFALSPG